MLESKRSDSNTLANKAIVTKKKDRTTDVCSLLLAPPRTPLPPGYSHLPRIIRFSWATTRISEKEKENKAIWTTAAGHRATYCI